MIYLNFFYFFVHSPWTQADNDKVGANTKNTSRANWPIKTETHYITESNEQTFEIRLSLKKTTPNKEP